MSSVSIAVEGGTPVRDPRLPAKVGYRCNRRVPQAFDILSFASAGLKLSHYQRPCCEGPSTDDQALFGREGRSRGPVVLRSPSQGTPRCICLVCGRQWLRRGFVAFYRPGTVVPQVHSCLLRSATLECNCSGCPSHLPRFVQACCFHIPQCCLAASSSALGLLQFSILPAVILTSVSAHGAMLIPPVTSLPSVLPFSWATCANLVLGSSSHSPSALLLPL